MKDNPRLINFPPRDSEQWKLEYNARTSAERSNKREKIDFQLESGRHRSTKMWYCLPVSHPHASAFGCLRIAL
ncbi:MAG: hypothetical protein ACLROG_16970 [Coprococcus phoceensis]